LFVVHAAIEMFVTVAIDHPAHRGSVGEKVGDKTATSCNFPRDS